MGPKAVSDSRKIPNEGSKLKEIPAEGDAIGSNANWVAIAVFKGVMLWEKDEKAELNGKEAV